MLMVLAQTHAVYWLVAVVLVVAAVIDGRELRVPNWLTFPFALVGLAASLRPDGLGLVPALLGGLLGLALLLPLYAVGGMGAGDVKLLAGVGAWIGPALLWEAFVASAIAGAAMAVIMMLASGRLATHLGRMRSIAVEWLVIRNPVLLAEIAAARKPSMTLLPYGIPIALGTLVVFLRAGLLV
jgi:prepilin peptidase CpaA